MRQLAPRYIIEHAEGGRFSGKLNAGTMFIDVSGFTRMTHTLMKNGKEGAEILTGIINRVFTPAIDSIYRNQGFVTSFAGDAFTAVFPHDRMLGDAPVRAAMDILTSFETIGKQSTRFGEFNLSVKIGISGGEVEWKIVQCDRQNAYYFRGKAIDGAAACEKQCDTGCAVADYDTDIPCEKQAVDGHFHLRPDRWIISDERIDIQTSDRGAEKFIPEAIVNLTSPGEFRDIVSLFVSFDEAGDLEKTLPEIVRLAVRYGGYFNKFDFGDKGGIALVIFGAPVGREKMFARACDYALALRQLAGIDLRIGMTFGTAFTGFVGSDVRSEYTALGMVVNLSARFAMKADYGDIYVDRFFSANLAQQYQIDFERDQDFKGFPEPVPVYLLKQRLKISRQMKFSGNLVDRESEIAELTKLLAPLDERKFGGLIYLDGAAGTGKSRLIHEITLRLTDYRWIEMPCDGILRKSFNPILHFLESQFEQEESRTHEDNRETFDQRFDAFLRLVLDRDLRSELQRTRSVVGGMLGLHWENSLFEQLDARGRYENTLSALKTLMIALSMQKPLVIIIDDGHLIDTDSLNWLVTLTRNVADYPFAIILPCRYKDDGSAFDPGMKEVVTHRVRVANLDEKAARKMIGQFLGHPDVTLPDSIFQPVWSKSGGNPFYIEQILLYLQENQLIADDLTLKEDRIEIPSRINEIIIARVDRLTEQVKQAVQTASVLGREFPVNILSRMLYEPSERIDEIVSEARRENIWMPLQKLRYIFNNILIREVVYGIQLKQRLRNLHKLAADTIRETFFADIEQHYSDLAYHYENAEITERAIEFLEKASNHAKRNYQNQAALEYRSRQIALLKQVLESSPEPRAETVQSLITALLEAKYYSQVLGNIEEAKAAVEEAAEIAHKWGTRRDIAKTDLDKANLLKLSGNYEQCDKLLQEAQEFFAAENELKMLGLTYLEMGVLSFWQGKQKDAFDYFEKELRAFEELGEPLRVAEALGNLGVIYRYTGDFEKSTDFLKRQLLIAEKQGDKIQISRTLGNLGWVLDGQQKYEEALEYYRQALTINRELGLKSEMIRMLDNIGYVMQCIGDYADALEHHQKALAHAKEINDIESLINIHANMARANKLSGRLDDAYRHFETGLDLIRQYGMSHSLPEFLIEKADLLFEDGKREEAKELAQEGLKKAEELNNAEFTEKGRELLNKIKNE